MRPIQALILGIVEGLTEYLPVSSTGHLIVASRAMQLKGDAADSFDIVVQAGAILAVLVHYRALLAKRAAGLFSRDANSVRLFSNLAIAFAPAAIVGLLFRHAIKEHLFKPKVVAAMFIVGGIVMIFVERFLKLKDIQHTTKLEDVTPAQALRVGIGQCFSLLPGMSRSMCTIVAGQLSGISTATAAELSFLVGLPTLGAATMYEGYKARHALMESIGLLNLGLGLVTSFLVAWLVIAAFIRYLAQRGLTPFGYYRIAASVVVWLVLVEWFPQ
jgi:undecaprenyl-diphosphatase